MTELSVRLAVLRNDAKEWGRASRSMSLSADSANDADLGVGQFGQIAQNVGLVSMYQSLQEAIATALSGASTEFARMDSALVAAADTYQREDEQGAHRFNEMGPK